jgi:hypothetical protein
MPLNESWLTRPLFSFPPRMARWLTVGIVVAILVFPITPVLVTLVWHLRHGNTIECRGKSIFVPLRWTAEIGDGNDAMLTKLPLAIWPPKPLTSIFFRQSVAAHDASIEDQYKTFQSLFWNLHSDLGEAISGPVRTGSGPREVFCMEGTTPHTTRSSASCVILGGTWTADFFGDKKDIAGFFTVIGKLY